MADNSILFYIASVMLITFALISVFARNIIYSLISAVMVFFLGAIIFYILGSEYNAIIQASVYGFAVPIIIAVSIMFTSGQKEKTPDKIFPYVLALFSGLFCLSFIHLLLRTISTSTCEIFNIVENFQSTFFDVISAFAKGIFINYVWAFELVSLLLVIVIAGIAMLGKRGS